MPDQELRNAIGLIVQLLSNTRIQEAIAQFRNAVVKNDLSKAGAELLVAGNKIIDGVRGFGQTELKAWQYMHLEQLGLPQYWNDLVSLKAGREETRAELVALYSRVMFASNHLPGLLLLLHNLGDQDDQKPQPAQGRDFLEVKLYDAGERAADPDRISRTLDGIDMVYASCVSLAKKSVTELSLVNITGDQDKHLLFEGDVDSISAVKTIIDSIADGIAAIEDINDFNPDDIVSNLPVFDDLRTLQKMGTFQSEETDQIADSLHEGCLLVMESGVMLDEDEGSFAAESESSQPKPAAKQAPAQVQTPAPVKNNEPPVTSHNIPKPLDDSDAATTDVTPVVSVKRINSIEKLAQDIKSVPMPSVDKAANSGEKSPNDYYVAYLREKNKKLEAHKKQTANPEKDVPVVIPKKKEPVSKEDALDELILDLNKITQK